MEPGVEHSNLTDAVSPPDWPAQGADPRCRHTGGTLVLVFGQVREDFLEEAAFELSLKGLVAIHQVRERPGG